MTPIANVFCSNNRVAERLVDGHLDKLGLLFHQRQLLDGDDEHALQAAPPAAETCALTTTGMRGAAAVPLLVLTIPLPGGATVGALHHQHIVIVQSHLLTEHMHTMLVYRASVDLSSVHGMREKELNSVRTWIYHTWRSRRPVAVGLHDGPVDESIP
jgi:hypothetical protein